jgi:hypothetical protein
METVLDRLTLRDFYDLGFSHAAKGWRKLRFRDQWSQEQRDAYDRGFSDFHENEEAV